MPNRLLALFLLVALLSASFSRYAIYAGFEANQSYIARVLCENKARPWLHCNGHCYLMKKLKEASDKEKKQDREDQKNRYQEAMLPASKTDAVFSIHFSRSYPLAIVPQVKNTSFSIFQPPQVIA